MKTIRNALLVSCALTGALFAWFFLTDQSEEMGGLWVYAMAMFFGVFLYLLIAGRKKSHKHRK